MVESGGSKFFARIIAKFGATFCALTALALCGLCVPFHARAAAEPAPLPAAKIAATVTSLSGLVTVRRGTQTAAYAHPLAVNETLYSGDLVTTSADGTAKLLFTDDSIIDLSPRSLFKIERFSSEAGGERQAVFSMLYGKLRALVTKALSGQSKFEIRTASGVMGVRGTEFIVSAPPELVRLSGAHMGSSAQTQVTVLHGSVALIVPGIQGPPALLGPNSQATVTLGQGLPPQIRALEPGQVQAISQGARVADNTFTRTVSMDEAVRNERAPVAAGATAIATANVSAAAALVGERPERSVISGVGTFGALDTITDAPASLLPANLQTITVRLSQ